MDFILTNGYSFFRYNVTRYTSFSDADNVAFIERYFLLNLDNVGNIVNPVRRHQSSGLALLGNVDKPLLRYSLS